MSSPVIDQPQPLPPVQEAENNSLEEVTLPSGPTPYDIMAAQGTVPWKHTLLGCLDDKYVCLKAGSLLPAAWVCIAMRLNVFPVVPLLLQPFSLDGGRAAMRAHFRATFKLKGSVVEDCIATTVCCPCGTCQILREMNEMGI